MDSETLEAWGWFLLWVLPILAGLFYGATLLVCLLKGQRRLVLIGIVLFPAMVPVFYVVGAAFGLAEPDSWWARRRYDAEKAADAEARRESRSAFTRLLQGALP